MISLPPSILQLLQDPGLPPTLNEWQQALWYAYRGNWESAHGIAQQHEGEKRFDRLHAYLHRAEGDAFNASYWYRRAGAANPGGPLADELANIIADSWDR